MNAEIFAEWLRRQGHRVIKTQSSYWYDASWRVYQAFPYHWLIRPPEEELREFFWKNRAISLRYSTPAESAFGRISYHAVYAAPQYSLELLDRRTRQNVRTGLSRCRVEPIPFEQLAEEGWLLERDTANRQGREVSTSQGRWRTRYVEAGKLAGFEAWGALVENRLVASLLTFQSGDCGELISQQCHRDYISARVNHALAFTVTQALCNRPGISAIFYTLQSLDAPASVDDFKFRMGYSAKKVRQRVLFHPCLAPMIGPSSLAIVERLARLRPRDPNLAKAAGMIQFFLEGRRPLNEQDWPECLIQGNEALQLSGAANAGGNHR